MFDSNTTITNYDTGILIANIKRYMSENNISQAKIAEVAGISQPRVSELLAQKEGKRKIKPRLRQINAIPAIPA